VHRGVRELITFIESHADGETIRVLPRATDAEFAEIEHALGSPLPTDLRLVLSRFNGAELPNGTLLGAGIAPGTIGACIREYAGEVERDFLDPELLVPFLRTVEGSLLAFDRSGGPVCDTWPIVDYDVESRTHQIVYRTFDGFCRVCVAEWTSPDFDRDFDLDGYLRRGERHVAVEADVPAAHASVAHACKRAGLAERALDHYLAAARFAPPLPRCDWEALKIAALLARDTSAFEAATRLVAFGPEAVWAKRETSPSRVAEVLAIPASRAADKRPWLRLFGLLLEHTKSDPAASALISEVREAVAGGRPLPLSRTSRPSLAPEHADFDAWEKSLRDGYMAGQIRDEDLLLDPTLAPIREARALGELLSIRREF
jgi:hypothetical protein